MTKLRSLRTTGILSLALLSALTVTLRAFAVREVAGVGLPDAWLTALFVLGLIALAGGEIVSLRRSNARLSQSKPLPRVKVVSAGGMFLEVTNEGERGDFEAQVELLAGLGQVHQIDAPVNFRAYPGVWERSHGPRSSLARSQQDRLIIGHVERMAAASPPAATFRMAFYDEVNHGYAEYGTTGWIAGVEGIVPPRLELRVTISSSPSAAKGPYVNTFIVDADDPKTFREESLFATFPGVTVRHY